ncbi:formylglycine-generating enzyme family protein [Treponema sp.]|uniref:formylglycine-generating enzyme family protein n=1 Tax=Treponema sp. TaxID=166 RepID=UPI003F10DD67
MKNGFMPVVEKTETYNSDYIQENIENSWLEENSGKTTHSVATKKPNQFGLYDMTGNVGEWCSDYNYSRSYNIDDDNYENFRYCIPSSWKDSFSSVNSFYPWEKYNSVGFRICRTDAKELNRRKNKFEAILKDGFSKIEKDGKQFLVLKTEVTEFFYNSVMQDAKCTVEREDFPAVNVSWYDRIYFCNALSKSQGFKEVYSVNGKKNVSEWNYVPLKRNKIAGKISKDDSADGFRLLICEEWIYFAKANENYKYPGSDDLKEVAWFCENSNSLKPVSQKKPNSFNLFDMSGNCAEWCFDEYIVLRENGYNDDEEYVPSRFVKGGCFLDVSESCSPDFSYVFIPSQEFSSVGFRIIRNCEEKK